MKNTILILLLLTMVLMGSCNKSKRKDRSLTLDEYKKMGIPEPDKIWSYMDYQRALAGLTQLKLRNRYALPVKDSRRSSALFSRLTNPDNMTFLKDGSIPLYQKAQMVKRYLEIQRELTDLYTDIRTKEQYYNRELIDIYIFGLRILQKMLHLAELINQSDNPMDMDLQTGYHAIQVLYVSHITWMLNEQKNPSKYLNEDLETLTDSITTSVSKNKYWMDTSFTKEIKQSLHVAIDSASSDAIKEKYTELMESL